MIRAAPLPSIAGPVASRSLAGRHMHGLSLIELMIAITLGLLVLAGLVTIYVDSSRSGNEFSKMNRQIENGRFALQMLREDLWHAGFWGEYRPPNWDEYAVGDEPAALPNPCLAFGNWGVTTADVEEYKKALLAFPVQGYDNGTSLPAECTMVSDRQSGTDVLFVRHADTCIAGAAGCEAVTGGKLYYQASLCSADETAYPSTPNYVIDTDAALHVLRTRDGTGKSCTATGYTTAIAGKRKLVSNLYYIRDYATTSGDGIPTLMRSVLDLAGGAVEHQPAQPLVEGIEHLAVEYGIDTDGDGDVDSFSSAPATIAAWGNVIAVNIHVLARNLEKTAGHSDTKTYTLGAGNTLCSTASTDAGCASKTLDPGYKRHVFSAFVRLMNPAGRRE